eukprot:5531936-Ditylum_brightwellii.AAC.1
MGMRWVDLGGLTGFESCFLGGETLSQQDLANSHVLFITFLARERFVEFCTDEHIDIGGWSI